MQLPDVELVSAKVHEAWMNGKLAKGKRQFPDGPKPLATFRTDDPTDMAKAKDLIGAEAITSHFKEGGDGMRGLIEALRGAGKLESE